MHLQQVCDSYHNNHPIRTSQVRETSDLTETCSKTNKKAYLHIHECTYMNTGTQVSSLEKQLNCF